MSQEVEKQMWALVSVTKENTTDDSLDRIRPQVSDLVDQWHSQGKILLSGPFDDNKTGLAIFEATEQEANEFAKKYEKAVDGVLDYYVYKWEALPFLSLFS